jgi:hypothetical protein
LHAAPVGSETQGANSESTLIKLPLTERLNPAQSSLLGQLASPGRERFHNIVGELIAAMARVIKVPFAKDASVKDTDQFKKLLLFISSTRQLKWPQFNFYNFY